MLDHKRSGGTGFDDAVHPKKRTAVSVYIYEPEPNQKVPEAKDDNVFLSSLERFISFSLSIFSSLSLGGFDLFLIFVHFSSLFPKQGQWFTQHLARQLLSGRPCTRTHKCFKQ